MIDAARKLTSFGIGLSNIPLVNLRWEFRDTSRWLKDPETIAQFARDRIFPIEMPWLIWGRMPNDLLTLLLQRMILGVEAYVPTALMAVSRERGMGSAFMQDLNRVLKGGKTARSYYRDAPSLIDPSMSLEAHDQPLYNRICVFYREVRNPLFHGKMVNEGGPAEVLRVFQLFERVYDWIDSWYPPDKVIPGLASSLKA